MSAYPFISILVAARNEEYNIIRCLHSLHRLDYPGNRIEILIGNDGSSDQTSALVRNFIHDKQQFRLLDIVYREAGLKGKTNVLAQLVRIAQGEYYFFCDADIAVNSNWIKNMLRHFHPGVGVVNGITVMESKGIYSDCQSIEWILALSSFKLLSFFNIPVTSMGNNMAVSSEAYHATGGYEHIGFSVVEDYALFKAILGKGYRFYQTFEPGVIAGSVPVDSIKSQLAQRKRWMQGAMQIPAWLISLFIAGTLLPLICLAFLPFYTLTSACLLFASYALITIFSGMGILYLNQFRLMKSLPFFWFYLSAMNLLSLISHFRPGKIVWKDREY